MLVYDCELNDACINIAPIFSSIYMPHCMVTVNTSETIYGHCELSICISELWVSDTNYRVLKLKQMDEFFVYL